MSGVNLSSLSPRSFKAETAKLSSDVDTFRENIQGLLDSFKKFSESGSVIDGAHLAEVISQLGSSETIKYCPEDISLIGDTLKGVEHQRKQLLDSIRMLLISPLEQFLRDDINEVEALRSAIESQRKEYDQAKLKYDVARTSKSKQIPRGVVVALEESKRALDSAELAYGNKLLDIRVKKEYEILERLCTYIFAEANFYHEGYQRLSKLEPSVRALMNDVIKSQKDFLEGKSKYDVDAIIAQHKTAPINTPIEIDLHFKQGYVNMKKRNTWTRRWLVVNKGLLFLYKNWKDMDPIKCANLLLCTVKQIASERPNTLMVISPDLSLTVQASDAEDLREWIAVVEAGIGWQLTKKKTDSVEQEQMTSAQEKFSYLRELRENEANRYCADCGAPDPEWGLMNLCVLICYECSGVHRSLGVHISKVRSLTLDKWNLELFYLISFFGNAKGNQIFEADYDQSIPKPTKTSDRSVREEFIRAKYEEKKFVRKFKGSPDQHHKEMLNACNKGDLYAVMECIMQGVDPNFYTGNPGHQISLLSEVVKTGTATTYVLELLMQNGAQVYASDEKGWTPLHYAAYHDRVTYARMLMMRGGSQTQEDKQGKSPYSISEEHPASQTLKYFNKEIKDEDLEGVQPADIASLNEIKTSFLSSVDVIRSKLNILRQELKVTESIEDANEILKQIRLVKLSLCFDSA